MKTRAKMILAAVAVGIIAWITALCGESIADSNAGSDMIETAAERGRSDALRAAEAPAGSMEQEYLVLDIRAKASHIQATGHVHAAESYLEAAEKVLKEKGIIP